MCIVYCIANQKGGCSKTSVTANLGIGLALTGKKVALIDADPQGSLTISLGYSDPDEIPVTLATIMTNIIDEKEFPAEYKDAYIKGMDLYHQGIFHLARDYFQKAQNAVPADKAAKLMFSRASSSPPSWQAFGRYSKILFTASRQKLSVTGLAARLV